MKVLAVCGAGMGTSVMMKIKLTQYLSDNNADAHVDSCGLDEGKGSLAGNDIVICSTHLAEELGTIPDGVTLIQVENIMKVEDFGPKILEIIKSKS